MIGMTCLGVMPITELPWPNRPLGRLPGATRPQPIPVVLFTTSEVPNEITTLVESVLIKSKTLEDKLPETIRKFIG